MTASLIRCRQCGRKVEEARCCYATPICFACLPPPKPLPIVGVHRWSVRYGITACERCGMVRRLDGPQKPCRGTMPQIGLRGQEPRR